MAEVVPAVTTGSCPHYEDAAARGAPAPEGSTGLFPPLTSSVSRGGEGRGPERADFSVRGCVCLWGTDGAGHQLLCSVLYLPWTL